MSVQKASLETIAKKMARLDLCMMITQDGRNGLHARPMSNNGKVAYDGNSWFFTYEGSHKVRQIEADARVSLVFQTKDALFIECYGQGSIVRDKATMADMWLDELKQWFPQALETPGICIVKVAATRVHFWYKEEEGAYESPERATA